MPWLLINLAYAVTTVQMIAMGVAFLKDKRPKPLFPRWLSWFGIWVGVSFAFELLLPFFKTGPGVRGPGRDQLLDRVLPVVLLDRVRHCRDPQGDRQARG